MSEYVELCKGAQLSDRLLANSHVRPRVPLSLNMPFDTLSGQRCPQQFPLEPIMHTKLYEAAGGLALMPSSLLLYHTLSREKRQNRVDRRPSNLGTVVC